jgi:hypothetical protein
MKKTIDHDCLKIYTYKFWGSKHCVKNMPHQTQKNPKMKTITIYKFNSMPWTINNTLVVATKDLGKVQQQRSIIMTI